MDLYHIPYTKIKSKWIKDLNIRPEIIKLLEENMSHFLDIGFGKDILIFTKVKGTKAKTNKHDYIKVKCFCTGKEVIKKTKREKVTYGMETNTCKPHIQ